MDKGEYIKRITGLENELIQKFGRQRLEETAFPTYFNKLPPAAYLAWSRIFHAQKLLNNQKGKCALDFGSGLGTMLPYLTKHYENVVATDMDTEITDFMIKKLDLKPIELVKDISNYDNSKKFDLIVALDVFEHVENLNIVLEQLNLLTNKNGTWIISGPTENFLYKVARKIARTTGEGHVRNIYDVFNMVPNNMVCEKVYRLPWGIPLFLVGRFKKKDSNS